MKKIFIAFILFLGGCKQQNDILNSENTTISLNNDLIFEYAEDIKLKDIVKIENGELINPELTLRTNKLGNIKINFQYKNDLKQIKNYEFEIKVQDTTKPTIYISNLTTTKGKKIDILKKAMCGDNYDRNLTCKVEGNYDFNVVGEYPLKIVAIDSSGNETSEDFKLKVQEKTQTQTPQKSYYYLEDLIKVHKGENTMIGIDVSSWQGDIDWQKVKNAGVEFAMIRIGYGQDKNDKNIFDSKFKTNLKKAKESGVLVGIYFYSYAKTKYDALKQAKWIIEALDGESLDLPIAFDWEIWSNFNSYKINFHDLNEIARTFIEEIENNGYQAMNYGSAFFMNRIWNIPEHETWLAHYTNKTSYTKPYYIWQLSNIGIVPGIDGYVDLDILYKK
ncbi:MAG: hypothetical protein IJO27_00090 [Bacilli bacterium]|nr:hypothetical protein [Bacilli bacterium]MBQ6816810.1 hypothetical protein [Bacilli bacterium]